MKLLVFLCVVSLGIAACGCERFTEYDFTLRNSTSATIIRFQSDESEFAPIDTTLLPGATLLLGDAAHIGVKESPPSIQTFWRNIVVTSTQGDTCLRDPNVNATWTTATELTNQRPKLYLHRYTLNIVDSDF